MNSSIPIFNGFRGVLAIWVMLSHVVQLVNAPLSVISKGGIAVDLFMLTSGFLMYWNMHMRADREQPGKLPTLQAFYIRRFFRIAPLYFVALFFSYLLADYWHSAHSAILAASGNPRVKVSNDCGFGFLFEIVMHITFLFGLIPCTSSSNILPDWSLSLEMQFYAVFPFLYLWAARGGTFSLAIFAAVLAFLSQRYITVYEAAPVALISFPQASVLSMRLNCFVVGIVIAKIMASDRFRLVDLFALILSLIAFQRMTFTLIAIALAAVLLTKRIYQEPLNKEIQFVFSKVETMLSCRLMSWFGDISYSVYLLHFFVLIPIISCLFSFDWFLELSGWNRFFLATGCTSFLVLFVSHFAHRFIEAPGIWVGRVLSQRVLQ